VVFATASNLQKLSPAIQSCFQRIIAIEQPTERQRELIIASMLRSVVVDGNQRDALANQVAGKTPSMLFADLKRLIDAAEYNAWLRGRTDGASTCRCCHWKDFETVLPAVRKQCEEIRRDDGDNQRFTLSAVPDVCWADVGGLEHAKREIMDAIELPLKYPHLFTQRSGDGGGISSRSGLLFFGPPGTGLLHFSYSNQLIIRQNTAGQGHGKHVELYISQRKRPRANEYVYR
jgi:peroxin-6